MCFNCLPLLRKTCPSNWISSLRLMKDTGLHFLLNCWKLAISLCKHYTKHFYTWWLRHNSNMCFFKSNMVNYYKGLVNVNIGDNEAYCWSSHCEVQSTDSCCHNWRFCDKKMTKKVLIIKSATSTMSSQGPQPTRWWQRVRLTITRQSS